MHENFKDFQFFAEWCQQQQGYGRQDWQLDKDILVKGNKVYGPETCVFVPRQINMLLKTSGKAKHDLPMGVRKKWSRYEVSHGGRKGRQYI